MVVDSPQRLELRVSHSRWIIAVVLTTLGALLTVGWRVEPSLWVLMVPAVLCWAGAGFFALGRQLWTFDGERGVVRYESLLWGTWEARLASVTDLRLESRSHGRAGEEIAVTALTITIEGRAKPGRVSASTDAAFVHELKRRIEAMVAPWRGATAPQGMA